jgi:replicative DNA helicase
MIEALQPEQDSGSIDTPFGPNMEASIVSLLLDFPELYIPTARFMTVDLFARPEVKYVIAAIQQDYEKFGIIPTRNLLHDRLAKILTMDDPYEEILAIVDKPSDPREAPILRQVLREWVEHKTYAQLYSDDALAAHQRGDNEYLRKIVESATTVSMVGQQGFWFFDQIDELFVDNAIEHISTGFLSLDANLNEGGPSPREVLIFLAPTGVGKTLTLVNVACAGLNAGHNVLFITFELSAYKTALRMISLMSKTATRRFSKSNIDKLPVDEVQKLRAEQAKVRNIVQTKKGKIGELVIYELPPDECSVDDVYGIIENNRKTRGWVPKIVVLDYLELMTSRRAYNNTEGDYTRQKSVATEMRGLAKNENVLVYSATQTNRSGVKASGGKPGQEDTVHIDLDKAAESFGKAMPVDYVVSLNQTEEEYNRGQKKEGEKDGKSSDDADLMPATIRLWIAKNRNGPKFVSITTNVFYDKMCIVEPDSTIT